jgi:PDZ domain-containing protein
LFAIGIIDKLTPGALTQGKIIAGTGTIDPDGNVGEIGGIRQKLIGARDAGAVLFLAPEGNCDEVIGHIPDGLTVVAIETLKDAMDEIEAFNAGKTVTPCVK